MRHLSPDSARSNLTDRECAKIVSSLCGGLTQMTSVETVRNALRWLVETDAVWDMFEQQKRIADDFVRQHMSHLAEKEPGRG